MDIEKGAARTFDRRGHADADAVDACDLEQRRGHRRAGRRRYLVVRCVYVDVFECVAAASQIGLGGEPLLDARLECGIVLRSDALHRAEQGGVKIGLHLGAGVVGPRVVEAGADGGNQRHEQQRKHDRDIAAAIRKQARRRRSRRRFDIRLKIIL